MSYLNGKLRICLNFFDIDYEKKVEKQ